MAEGLNPNTEMRSGEQVRSVSSISKPANSEARLHAAMSRGKEDFDTKRDRAVAERGIVTPGLADMKVRVVEVPRHDFTGTGREVLKAAEKWAKENIVGEHTAIDSEGEEFNYSISNDAVEKYVSKSATDKSANIGVHLAVLKKLPEVISESIEAEIHPDYYKGDDGMRRPGNGYSENNLVHRFYGHVKIDGENYCVKTTLIESRTPSEGVKPHSFEVTEIELLSEDNSSKVAPTASGYQGQLPHGTAKLLKGVEKSYDAGKRLLDESAKADESRRYSLVEDEQTVPSCWMG